MTSAPDAPAPLAGRVVLVTGARGFLGTPLVEALLAGGADVHAITRGDPATAPPGPVWWQADVASGPALGRVLDAVRPDLVYHLTSAGRGGRELELVAPTVRDDLTATIELLRAVTERGVGRVVLTGSMEEPTGEADAVPSSPYAAAKWAACGYARMFHALYGLPVVILRPFMTYGPGQKPFKLVPYVVGSLLRDEAPQVGTGARPVDWVYVDDMVEAFVRAGWVDEAVGRTLELGSGRLTTVREVVELLQRLVASSVAPDFGATPDRPLEVVRAAAVADAAEILGWRARTSLEEGLRRTVDWHRAQQPPRDGSPPPT